MVGHWGKERREKSSQTKYLSELTWTLIVIQLKSSLHLHYRLTNTEKIKKTCCHGFCHLFDPHAQRHQCSRGWEVSPGPSGNKGNLTWGGLMDQRGMSGAWVRVGVMMSLNVVRERRNRDEKKELRDDRYLTGDGVGADRKLARNDGDGEPRKWSWEGEWWSLPVSEELEAGGYDVESSSWQPVNEGGRIFISSVFDWCSTIFCNHHILLLWGSLFWW